MRLWQEASGLNFLFWPQSFDNIQYSWKCYIISFDQDSNAILRLFNYLFQRQCPSEFFRPCLRVLHSHHAELKFRQPSRSLIDTINLDISLMFRIFHNWSIPFSTAISNAVFSCLFLRLISAPCFTSNSTISPRP